MPETARQETETPAERQERFMALLDPVHDNLARYVRAMSRNRDEARDLMSETLLAAYENFDTLKAPAAFLSYLFTIARRICRHRTRRFGLFADYDEKHVTGLHATTPAPDAAADIPALYNALDRLPAEQREAVALFELSGLSLEEIREIQGGTLSGVKARVARGRRKLAKLLGVEEDDYTAPQQQHRDNSAGNDDATTLLHFSTAKHHG
jgi:RNA polymerase sigma-70 factor (ECF subfamily)